MRKLDSDGAFSHCRRDTFHGTVAHIAGNKYAGNAGFQQERLASFPPPFGQFTPTPQILTSEYKSLLVAQDRRRQPFHARLRSDKDEE
jgi:hypothetical protein